MAIVSQPPQLRSRLLADVMGMKLLALTALVVGALNVTAFAPLGWWAVQIATLALASYWLAEADTPKRSFLTGLAFGFGWMASGIYWLYISLHSFGGLNPLLAALAVGLLAAYMALFPALAFAMSSFLIRRWQQPVISKSVDAGDSDTDTGADQRALYVARITPACASLLVVPACWTLTEWLRGWLLTGFPWLASGYAHTDSPLRGFAPLAGVYGVGFVAMFFGGLIALILHYPARSKTQRILYLAAIAVIISGAGLDHIHWTQPSGKPISVELTQGNIAQEFKFSREETETALHWYLNTIQASHADLIATPETAIPAFPQDLYPGQLTAITEHTAAYHQVAVIGMPTADYSPESGDGKPPENVRNSALVFGSNSGAPYIYSKAHLVPFGEFIPSGFHWFVAMLNIPLGDLARGNRLQAPFAVKDQWVLPNICYEDLFGEEIAYQLRHSQELNVPPATLLLNMSNIAWFGNTLALPQHLQISRMRSLETGRPMLRSTNTGATAIIDARGQVVDTMSYYSRGKLQAPVQGYAGNTPYILFGNTLIIWIALLCLIAACVLLQNDINKNSRLKR